MEVQRQRGVQTTIYFTMVKAGSTDLAVTGDWTPATGDTKISKDGSNVTNSTNNPAVVGGTGSVMWKLVLTLTEMDAQEIDIQIVDSATKAVEDNVIIVSTRIGGVLVAPWLYAAGYAFVIVNSMRLIRFGEGFFEQEQARRRLEVSRPVQPTRAAARHAASPVPAGTA